MRYNKQLFADGDNNVLTYDKLSLYDSKIKELINTKQTAESGKGLSSNDYTNAEKAKLAGIAENANDYVHPTYTPRDSGFYKVTVDGTGHVSSVTPVVKSDITALIGEIPEGTTYDVVSASSNGLMSSAMLSQLNNLTNNAAGYQTASDVQNAVNNAGHLKHAWVASLPDTASADKNTIYHVTKTGGSATDGCDEYVLNQAGTGWEMVGKDGATITAITTDQINALFA